MAAQRRSGRGSARRSSRRAGARAGASMRRGERAAAELQVVSWRSGARRAPLVYVRYGHSPARPFPGAARLQHAPCRPSAPGASPLARACRGARQRGCAHAPPASRAPRGAARERVSHTSPVASRAAAPRRPYRVAERTPRGFAPRSYDLSSTTYSPDGKVFQIEYAAKAVDNSGCVAWHRRRRPACKRRAAVANPTDACRATLLRPAAPPWVCAARTASCWCVPAPARLQRRQSGL